jgi:hypothetical protein|tara:strand:+ start:812 stop:1039 length:228 start_codon:yes stop_codon:yes gene_type:complete
MYDEFEDYDPQEELDWYVQLTMGIDELRLFYDHICYSIEIWPGSPARPAEEQEYLMSLKYKTYAMILQYTHDQGN